MVVAMVTESELFKSSGQDRLDLAYYTKNSVILTVLARDSDGYIRNGVAVNQNTPADTLTVLASDPFTDIRNCVAANPNTPADTLTVLASDPHDRIRDTVAANPNTLADTLTVLASDVNDDTRWRTARNFAAPDELLWCLLTDTDKDIADNVTARLQTKNLSLTDPTWVDPITLKTIYDVLQTNNVLNTPMLIQLLKAKVALSKTELIELCELYGSDVRELIKTNYELTHPLLKQMLAPAPKHTLSSTVCR